MILAALRQRRMSRLLVRIAEKEAQVEALKRVGYGRILPEKLGRYEADLAGLRERLRQLR